MLLLAGMLTLAAHAAPAQRPPRPPAPEAAARGFLGIGLDPEAARGGVLVVADVFEGSPARRAGLQRGDTVVMWNGRRDVREAMMAGEVEPGDTVRLRIRRAGERDRDLAVVAGKRPDRLVELRRGPDDEEVLVLRPRALSDHMRLLSDSLAVHAEGLHHRLQVMLRDSLGPRLRELEREHLPQIEARMREMEDRFRLQGESLTIDLGRRGVAGAEFAEVNAGLSSYFGTDSGALVIRVAPETPAARSGLQAGDVVVGVAGQPVRSIADLRRAVARSGEERNRRAVRMEILRKGQRRQLDMSWE